MYARHRRRRPQAKRPITWSPSSPNARRPCPPGYNNGYLSAYPESFFDRLDAGKHVWAPYYTIHKIMAGLLDAYQHCGNQQALDDPAKRMAGWSNLPRSADSFHAQMQAPLQNEHGGMNEVLADLYAVTGDPRTSSWPHLRSRWPSSFPWPRARTTRPACTPTRRSRRSSAPPGNRGDGRPRVRDDRRLFLGSRRPAPFLGHRRQQRERAFLPVTDFSQPSFADHRRDLQHLQHAEADPPPV